VLPFPARQPPWMNTMTHEEAFLQAILDDPDDDGVRLIFADWLDEHRGQAGAARAEFIRGQIQLAGLDDDHPQKPSLQQRERELLGKHEKAWLQPLRPSVREWAFARGFVEEVRVWTDEFLRSKAAAFRKTPVRHARFSDATRGLPRLLQRPELVRLRSLDLGYNQLNPESMRELASCPHLPNLVRLDVARNPILEAGFRELASAPFPQLRELLLAQTGLTPAGLEALLQAPHLPPPRLLDLRYNTILTAGAEILARSSRCAELETLLLDGPASFLAGNLSRGEVRVDILIESTYLTRLSRLSLVSCGLDDEAVGVLANSNLGNLQTLDLSLNNIGDAGARTLLRSQKLARLREIRLTGNTRISGRVQKQLQERFKLVL
jgi:uncharacterized protein (TIGR02996 family)